MHERARDNDSVSAGSSLQCGDSVRDVGMPIVGLANLDEHLTDRDFQFGVTRSGASRHYRQMIVERP